jgi:hypothetical protein
MKSLGASKEVPAVMTITEDLLETIKKMPEWKHVDFTFLAKFREDLVEKKVVYNSHPEVQQMMYALLYDYLEERDKALPKESLSEYDEVA